jgi:predicted GNAT superfamily acetyltransferase
MGCPGVEIRDAIETDFNAIVALNDAEVLQTSPMDRHRLRVLDRLSDYHKVSVVDGVVAAFLLAMREDAAYENENHAWFATRYRRFIYIDRIVVASRFAGRGIGRDLYEALFAHARSHCIPHVVCEYNVEPPNPASRAFHDRFGFTEIGTQWVANGSKRVSLQVVESR